MERIITIQQIKDAAQEAYNLYKDNTGGKNADYIPYLANIDSKLFGISICLIKRIPVSIIRHRFMKYFRDVSITQSPFSPP